MKTRWGSGGTAPHILNLSTTQRSVVNFMPQLLYIQGKSFQYPLYRRLGGAPEPVWMQWQKKKKNPFSNPTKN